MAKIGLIDVDGKNFPNLVSMKISSWHKSAGDDVEWYDGLSHYDRVYMSKVFSFSPDYTQHIDADEIVKGGTGYALHGAGGLDFCAEEDKPLPYGVEHSYPDYSLYPNLTKDTAYGFLTRGCPRGCHFCIVGKKEGLKSVKVADLGEFWHGQKNICLNDPNILACKEREELLVQLLESKAVIEFNQGLDIRMINPEICKLLNSLRLSKVHFAWDRYQDKDIVLPKFEMLAEYAPKIAKSHNTLVYTITNFDTTLEQDLDRIYTLQKLNIRPYVMIYDKPNAPKIYKKLQQWCNSYAILAKCPDFGKYNPHSHENTSQLSNQMKLF